MNVWMCGCVDACERENAQMCVLERVCGYAGVREEGERRRRGMESGRVRERVCVCVCVLCVWMCVQKREGERERRRWMVSGWMCGCVCGCASV